MKLSKENELEIDGRSVGGRWFLDKNHQIGYRVDGEKEVINLKGSILEAGPSTILVSITQRQSDQKVVTRALELTGRWALNLKNQIEFQIEREKGSHDTLTFQGTWEVAKTHEIIYRYKQTQLKKKQRLDRELIFRGHWDLTEKNRLTYFFSEDSDSAFRFRGSFQTKSILAKRNQIRYQAGVETAAGRRKTKTIALFGKWKVSHDLELSFEIEYANGKKRAIVFGAEYELISDARVEVRLKNREGEPLGLELVLTKDIFNGDGQAFVGFTKSLEESAVETGVRFRW